MDKNKAIEIAGAYFPHYPKVTSFHVCHDEQVFEQRNDAVNHGRSFEKAEEQEPIEVKRSEWFAKGAMDEMLKRRNDKQATDPDATTGVGTATEEGTQDGNEGQPGASDATPPPAGANKTSTAKKSTGKPAK